MHVMKAREKTMIWDLSWSRSVVWSPRSRGNHVFLWSIGDETQCNADLEHPHPWLGEGTRYQVFGVPVLPRTCRGSSAAVPPPHPCTAIAMPRHGQRADFTTWQLPGHFLFASCDKPPPCTSNPLCDASSQPSPNQSPSPKSHVDGVSRALSEPCVAAPLWAPPPLPAITQSTDS